MNELTYNLNKDVSTKGLFFQRYIARSPSCRGCKLSILGNFGRMIF